MELGFLILAAVIVLILIYTVWRLDKLQKQLNTYNDYVGKVRNETMESVLSEEFLNQLRNNAQLQLNNTIKSMDKQLQQALRQSYQQLINNIEKQAAQIINGELDSYRKTIAEARTSASNVSKEAEKQIVEIRESVQKEAKEAVYEEKQQLLKRIDDKLSDTIVYYLADALGEHVDLGSQKDYILNQLENHKEEIKQDINDEF